MIKKIRADVRQFIWRISKPTIQVSLHLATIYVISEEPNVVLGVYRSVYPSSEGPGVSSPTSIKHKLSSCHPSHLP